MLIEIYLTDEIWKPITYPGVKPNLYEISNRGRVKNVKRNKILKTPKQNNLGYRRMILQTGDKECQERMFSIHRLVAYEFIPNPNNLPMVNHKIPGYEGKGFNCVENLEWMTAKENIRYAVFTHQHWQYVGEHHPNSKFSNVFTLDIYNLCQLGNTSREIIKYIRKNYREYNDMTDKTLIRFIQRVRNGSRRRHITNNKESSTTIQRNID